MTGEALYRVCSDGLPLAASLSYARSHGGPALAHMTFQQRAQMLKAVAKHLLAHKEALYQISYQTGATRSDGWVDIEGGIATLFAYAGMAGRDLPDDTLWPEDELIPLSKQAQFAARHVLTSRSRRGAAHQRLQLPVLGHAGKTGADGWRACRPSSSRPPLPRS